MYDELNSQLAELKEQWNHQRKIEAKLASCRNELNDNRKEVADIEEKLAHHEHVLEKLHGLSFVHLMAIIRGVENERDRALHREVARLKSRLNSLRVNLRGLQEEEQILGDELDKIGDVERAYNEVLAKKEKEIIASSNSFAAKQYLELDHRTADINSQLKETDEAYRAARQAESALDDCLESLDKARDWGVWDMMGGGTITTMIKRSHMDDAESKMDHANYYVRRLARELQDVDGDIGRPVDVNPGGFLHFADYFFDDFFVDWAVQDQIKQAVDEVTVQFHKIEELASDLEQRLQSLEDERDVLLNDKKRLIEEAN